MYLKGNSCRIKERKLHRVKYILNLPFLFGKHTLSGSAFTTEMGLVFNNDWDSTLWSVSRRHSTSIDLSWDDSNRVVRGSVLESQKWGRKWVPLASCRVAQVARGGAPPLCHDGNCVRVKKGLDEDTRHNSTYSTIFLGLILFPFIIVVVWDLGDCFWTNPSLRTFILCFPPCHSCTRSILCFASFFNCFN